MNKTEESPAPDELEAGDDAAPQDALPVEDAAEETAETLDPLAAETARAARLEERIKRLEAEFVNETRRINKRADERHKFAIESVVVELLPVLDALHSARKELGDDDETAGMRQGLDLVGKQLTTVLERNGVREIEALGQPFDPVRHEAIMMIERDGFEPQSVCEVLRPGYDLNGRVVRAAEVIVVKPPPAPEAPAASDETGDDAGDEAGGE